MNHIPRPAPVVRLMLPAMPRPFPMSLTHIDPLGVYARAIAQIAREVLTARLHGRSRVETVLMGNTVVVRVTDKAARICSKAMQDIRIWNVLGPCEWALLIDLMAAEMELV